MGHREDAPRHSPSDNDANEGCEGDANPGLDPELAFRSEGMNVSAMAFADDLILTAESPSGLQTQINRLSSFLVTSGLEANAAKSSSLVIEPSGWQKRSKDTPLDLYYAAVEDGGLGVPCLRTTIPAMRLKGRRSAPDKFVVEFLEENSLREEKRRTRQASKKAIQQDSGATSEEEEHHGSEESEASVDAGAEQLTANQNEEEFPAIPQSQGGTSVVERGCKSTPLQRVLKADKKLFKALSIIATEAPENESVATQIDLIINEVAKMKALILEATHEVASLQGELRATHGTRSTGPMPSMADVVRAASPGDQGRPPRPIKPTEAIVRELQSNAATRHTVEVTRGQKKLPQIKIVGISDDITDEEISARLVSQNDLQCATADLTLVKSWRGRAGKTVCLDITK
ncbi:hypothetical protein HPB52_022887 [Rhipicephalus sanguineus]|uniref:Reverse transcriptase domain-containing protein n=1 Tax=Rhipicephalus sanguineus TaxID=34632 RepID=A0A9D4T2B7_RHISA|nr:hypothetical protein HPB52_022887 [Rhipicephalus sanguineus]